MRQTFSKRKSMERFNNGNKQINMEGGQSTTYLRLKRASSGPRVSVAKTYRDENESKMNISAKSQWPSSAVEYKRLRFRVPKYRLQENINLPSTSTFSDFEHGLII